MNPGNNLTPTELDALLDVLQKRGVRTYQIKDKLGAEFRLELGPAMVAGQATPEERQRTQKEIEAEREALLFAATEGFPT